MRSALRRLPAHPPSCSIPNGYLDIDYSDFDDADDAHDTNSVADKTALADDADECNQAPDVYSPPKLPMGPRWSLQTIILLSDRSEARADKNLKDWTNWFPHKRSLSLYRGLWIDVGSLLSTWMILAFLPWKCCAILWLTWIGSSWHWLICLFHFRYVPLWLYRQLIWHMTQVSISHDSGFYALIPDRQPCQLDLYLRWPFCRTININTGCIIQSAWKQRQTWSSSWGHNDHSSCGAFGKW